MTSFYPKIPTSGCVRLPKPDGTQEDIHFVVTSWRIDVDCRSLAKMSLECVIVQPPQPSSPQDNTPPPSKASPTPILRAFAPMTHPSTLAVAAAVPSPAGRLVCDAGTGPQGDLHLNGGKVLLNGQDVLARLAEIRESLAGIPTLTPNEVRALREVTARKIRAQGRKTWWAVLFARRPIIKKNKS